MTSAFFRGFFPSVTLANELKGARDGRRLGHVRASSRWRRGSRLFASKDVWIDACVPLGARAWSLEVLSARRRRRDAPTEPRARLRFRAAALRHRAALHSRAPRPYNVLPSLDGAVADGSQGRAAGRRAQSRSSPRSTACCVSERLAPEPTRQGTPRRVERSPARSGAARSSRLRQIRRRARPRWTARSCARRRAP